MCRRALPHYPLPGGHVTELAAVGHQPDLLVGAAGRALLVWNAAAGQLLFHGGHDYLTMRDIRVLAPKSALAPMPGADARGLGISAPHLYLRADNGSLARPLRLVARVGRDELLPEAAVMPLCLRQAGRMSLLSAPDVPYRGMHGATATALARFLLATGTAAGRVLLHDATSGACLGAWVAAAPGGSGTAPAPVRSLAFLDAATLLVGQDDAMLAVLDLSTVLPPSANLLRGPQRLVDAAHAAAAELIEECRACAQGAE